MALSGMIKPPSSPLSHPDIDIECENALSDEFSRLIDKAVQAGWSAPLVIEVLGNLALKTLIAHIEAPGSVPHSNSTGR
jgi:hypothetical protein